MNLPSSAGRAGFQPRRDELPSPLLNFHVLDSSSRRAVQRVRGDSVKVPLFGGVETPIFRRNSKLVRNASYTSTYQ